MNSLTPILAASLLAAIWQSALLAICVAVCLRLMPGITAKARSLVWTGIFLLMTLLPFASLLSVHAAPAASSAHLHLAPWWAVALVCSWAALSIICAARLLAAAAHLYCIATRSTPVTPSADIATLLKSTGRKVALCTSNEVDVPSVAGFFRPRILLPPTLLSELSPADLRQVVLHELEHLRRNDDWTNLLQKLGLALFPLNPVLLWVERRLCLERELACDDGVLHATGPASGAAKAYATCLANLAEHSLVRRGVSLALGAWQRQSELARRVHRILSNPVDNGHRIPTAGLAAFMLAATTGIGFVAAKAPQLITFGDPAAPSISTAVYTPAPYLSSFHPTLAKAIMPQNANQPASQFQRPLPLLTSLHRPAGALHPRRRMISVQSRGKVLPRAESLSPNIVLIRWQQTGARPRWTFAISPDLHFQTSQFTYAAVPVSNSWFIIQL